MTLADTITSGLNNPDCAFFVGQMYGQSHAINILLWVLLVGAIYKVLDKLVLDPLIKWIKKKIRRE